MYNASLGWPFYKKHPAKASRQGSCRLISRRLRPVPRGSSDSRALGCTRPSSPTGARDPAHPCHARPFCPAKSTEGREPKGERMWAEHQFLSTAEGELGGEARRRRGRGRVGDPQARVLRREPLLRAARESAVWVLRRQSKPYPAGWEMPSSTPRPASRSGDGSRDGRRGRGSRKPRGGLLRADRRELRPGMLRLDCTNCPTPAEAGRRTGWGRRARGGEVVGGGDWKVVQRGWWIWPPRALRRPESWRRIHPRAPVGQRDRSTSRGRGGDPAAWAAGFAVVG
jgi:hypothetical protein